MNKSTAEFLEHAEKEFTHQQSVAKESRRLELRDRYAGMAMQAILSEGHRGPKEIAQTSVKYADLLLKELGYE